MFPQALFSSRDFINMMKCVILVDNSNVFIQGKKHSARLKGVLPPPGGRQQSDPSWRIDFGGLLNVLADGRDIDAALLSVPVRPRTTVSRAPLVGLFTVFVHDRDVNNKEKAVDTELVAQGTG